MSPRLATFNTPFNPNEYILKKIDLTRGIKRDLQEDGVACKLFGTCSSGPDEL